MGGAEVGPGGFFAAVCDTAVASKHADRMNATQMISRVASEQEAMSPTGGSSRCRWIMVQGKDSSACHALLGGADERPLGVKTRISFTVKIFPNTDPDPTRHPRPLTHLAPRRRATNGSHTLPFHTQDLSIEISVHLTSRTRPGTTVSSTKHMGTSDFLCMCSATIHWEKCT